MYVCRGVERSRRWMAPRCQIPEIRHWLQIAVCTNNKKAYLALRKVLDICADSQEIHSITKVRSA